MRLLQRPPPQDFEKILALRDPSSALSGFIVIHSSSRGPAAGGIRLFPYRSEEEALADGLRLARAMSLKAAAAGLPVGGGKIVLLDHPELPREKALRAVGRAIESLSGRFLAGRDVGVSVGEGAWVRDETRFMVDESDRGVGDLNRATALGVAAGARAALDFRLGSRSWTGVRVALQGAGGVGSWLARLLYQEGAELVVADPLEAALEALAREVAFQPVAPDEIYAASEDVFCPCALGGVLHDRSIERLRARVVAGSANNVLAEPRHGQVLFARGIAYAPDFLVNAGALIQGIRFLLAAERDSREAIERIGERTRRLLEASASAGEPPEALLERAVLGNLNLAYRQQN